MPCCQGGGIDVETPTWEDTPPHFSTREKGDRITAPPLNAPGMLGFIAAVTFVLWIPAGAAGAIFFHGMSQRLQPPTWHAVLIVLYTFLPMILTDLTSDEARDKFGQRSTARRVAAIPAMAGAAAGLLVAALWIGGARGGFTALAGVACSIAAGLVTLVAWRGVRYTHRRHAWMASMHHYGRRSPGFLREITFLQKWSDSDPQFRVVVEFTDESGPQWVDANMTTTTRRVPLPGTSVVVSRSAHDPAAELFVELDYAAGPRFDTDYPKYEQPSAT